VSDYQFTKDWFHWAPEVWTHLIPMLPERVGQRHFLEIGSFEGRSAIWIAENMMVDDDELRCIDTWQGGEEHGTEDMGSVEERFRRNITIAAKKMPRRRIFQLPGSSDHRLAGLYTFHDTQFDFIYIDGSHMAKDVLTDACMAWPLLKAGGIMAFDDYLWGDARDILHRPKLAVDAFSSIFAEELEVIHTGYQFIVRKRA